MVECMLSKPAFAPAPREQHCMGLSSTRPHAQARARARGFAAAKTLTIAEPRGRGGGRASYRKTTRRLRPPKCYTQTPLHKSGMHLELVVQGCRQSLCVHSASSGGVKRPMRTCSGKCYDVQECDWWWSAQAGPCNTVPGCSQAVCQGGDHRCGAHRCCCKNSSVMCLLGIVFSGVHDMCTQS